LPAAAIVRALDGEGSPPETLSGTWVHADDHSAAVELVLREGAPGEVYRVGEDDDAIRALGWEPTRTLEDGLAETVEWYRSRRDWWEPIRSRTETLSPEEQYARRDA
jgi:dTDP-D-glucose 4,6-dehydratase